MLNVAFYVESEAFRWMADFAVASARVAMPGARIWHLTAGDFPKLKGADAILRGSFTDESFLGRYFSLAREIPGNVAMVNCDVVFNKSIDAFATGLQYPVAAPHIASPDFDYDGALILANNSDPSAQRFWDVLLSKPAMKGIERSVDDQLEAINSSLYSRVVHVGSLSGLEYSYVPKHADDYGHPTCRMLHYRGPRKEWMAKRLKVAADVAKLWTEGRETTHPGRRAKP